MNWFVIYTKSRQEKKVALELEKMGITVYCPMINQIRQWSDRKKKVEVPLISSYVFVQLKERDREAVFEVPGIVRYVYWLEKPAIVRDEEIAVMKAWLSTQTVEAKVEGLRRGSDLRRRCCLVRNRRVRVRRQEHKLQALHQLPDCPRERMHPGRR